MLDLDAADLARFQKIAPIVGFENRPGVQTALALSGSSAQSRIQAYPADADFFERIHITAPTKEEACRILGVVIRDKAMATMSGPTHRLWEVKLGTWDADVTKDGTLKGPNLELLSQVCARTARPVIASGGIANLDDIAELRELVPQGVEGAIVGKALYAGAFTLAEALDVAGD